MNNLRIKFVRGEEVKFISHLDLMKVFERAARRADILIAHSQGFNPHAHLIFGLPLSVGVTSQAEYADVELAEEVSPESFINKMNNQLPKGLYILDAKIKQSKDNIMASISEAAYEILFSANSAIELEELQNKIKAFLDKTEIIVKKESKKGVRELDIKPMIEELVVKKMCDLCDNSEVDLFLHNYLRAQSDPSLLPPSYNLENIYCISVMLCAGSVANLKPELLFDAFKEFLAGEIKLVKIHRSGLFVKRGGVLKNPLDSTVL